MAGAIAAWFVGWFLVVLPVSYWVGVDLSGWQEDSNIVQGFGSDAIDVAIEEVLFCIAALSILWLVVWSIVIRWIRDRRSAAPNA